MKHFISFCAVVLFVLAAKVTMAAPQNTDTLVVKTNIYCNHCKQCESCKGKLDLLMEEKGVKDMVLNVELMTITVVYNSKKTSPEKIRTAISNLGYDADNVPANPKAYEELDGCCKK